jgi:F-type H+-transporting ATPase subunit epsilon
MATFHFDLVSPDRMVFSGEVEHVVVPGVDGEFGVLAEHAPLVAMLKPGILVVLEPAPAKRIVVGGGYAEVNPRGLTVLAELAVPIEDFDRAKLVTQIKDSEEDVADLAEGPARDRAREKLEQLRALQEALGH